MSSKVWHEISYPFPNFNGCTVEVWEWITNFIPRFINYLSMLVKAAPGGDELYIDYGHISLWGLNRTWVISMFVIIMRIYILNALFWYCQLIRLVTFKQVHGIHIICSQSDNIIREPFPEQTRCHLVTDTTVHTFFMLLQWRVWYFVWDIFCPLNTPLLIIFVLMNVWIVNKGLLNTL